MITNFDSIEEELFYWYLEELKDAKYVESFYYQPDSIELSKKYSYFWKQKLKSKIINKESAFLQPHVYTADYKIIWNENAHGIFWNSIEDGIHLDKIPFITLCNNVSYIEVKPAFDYQNMTRLFTINQKWVYEQEKIYVQKIIPISPNKNNLFAKTFTPMKALLTKKKKQKRKLKFEPRTLKEFIDGIK